jgi:hypothetical protein
MATDEQRRGNRRTGLILASIALAFLVGYVVRHLLLG